jgi:hypothetical protein
MYDPQCAAVYRAERDLLAYIDVRHLQSMDAVQRFVQRVINSDWWVGPHVVDIEHLPGRRYADSVERDGVGIIRLPRWAWMKPTILHELTHLATPLGQPHGPTFCARLWEAHVRFSPGTAEALLEAFEWRGVKVG